jgi:arabinose-5-phosphate isomerase
MGLSDNTAFFEVIFSKELESIKAAYSNFQRSEIDSAINLIANTSGSIIFAGLGKSGLIGKKLAATFSSLGTRAFFLHAAEAMHGDLGVLHPSDLVVAISHSGETNELLRLVCYALENKNKIVAITGNKNSALARVSSSSIVYSLTDEACHMNLAPTSSTTIQMMIGDALAVTIAYIKKYSSEDFSRIHPAGNLGKRLLLKVHDIFNERAAVLSRNSSLYDAVIEMTSKHTGIAIVINEDKTLAGVLTDGDLRRVLLKQPQQIQSIQVADFFTKRPRTIGLNDTLDSALRLIQKELITGLIVVDAAGLPKGVITINDIEQTIAQ